MTLEYMHLTFEFMHVTFEPYISRTAVISILSHSCHLVKGCGFGISINLFTIQYNKHDSNY